MTAAADAPAEQPNHQKLVTGADERIQPVEDDAEHWVDAHTFTVWEPTDGLFLLVRLAVLPNVPAATAGVLAWLAAKPAYSYGHALDEAPLGDWDDLAIAGLHVEELEPLTTWELNLDDGDNGLSLRFDALSGAVRYAPPTAYATGHYEQTGRVRGRVTLHGRTTEVDAVGQREHTWGARDLAALAEGAHAVTAFLGLGTGTGDRLDERIVDVLDVGVGVAHGYVRDGGADHRIVAVERTTTPGEDGVAMPQALTLDVTVQGGRRFGITGTAHGTPITVAASPTGGLAHLQPMRFTTDDGLDGYGLSELVAP